MISHTPIVCKSKERLFWREPTYRCPPYIGMEELWNLEGKLKLVRIWMDDFNIFSLSLYLLFLFPWIWVSLWLVNPLRGLVYFCWLTIFGTSKVVGQLLQIQIDSQWGWLRIGGGKLPHCLSMRDYFSGNWLVLEFCNSGKQKLKSTTLLNCQFPACHVVSLALANSGLYFSWYLISY